jgi:hypothetical protein
VAWSGNARGVVSFKPEIVGKEGRMDDSKSQQVVLAHLASVIERAAGDLALEEEPARFAAALEDGADPEQA